jgi:hypothetical protein
MPLYGDISVRSAVRTTLGYFIKIVNQVHLIEEGF